MNQRYGRFGWSKGSILNLCIGQGELLVTPMQVFKYLNLLVTQGNTHAPHFVKTDRSVPVKCQQLNQILGRELRMIWAK